MAVSTWLRKQAQDSALTKRLPVEVIPNVIDRSLFVPSDKAEARKSLSLPLDKKIILMGAALLMIRLKVLSILKGFICIKREIWRRRLFLGFVWRYQRG